MPNCSFRRFSALVATCFCLLAGSNAAKAMPAVIDFEGLALGDAGPSYSESGVTFTPVAPGTSVFVFDLPNSGRAIIGRNPGFVAVRADIAGLASMVSVLLGDNNIDDDQMYLRAFNTMNTQIAEATVDFMGSGFATLTVNVPNIAYVIFGATDPIGGNSVVADEFSFTRVAVPEPATLALFGLGLAGLGFAARRKRKTA